MIRRNYFLYFRPPVGAPWRAHESVGIRLRHAFFRKPATQPIVTRSNLCAAGMARQVGARAGHPAHYGFQGAILLFDAELSDRRLQAEKVDEMASMIEPAMQEESVWETGRMPRKAP